jgi:hypothetical protein
MAATGGFFVVVSAADRSTSAADPRNARVDALVDMMLRSGHAVRLVLGAPSSASKTASEGHNVELNVPTLTWRRSHLEVLLVEELGLSHCVAALAPSDRFGTSLIAGVAIVGQPWATSRDDDPASSATNRVFDDGFGVSCVLEAVWRRSLLTQTAAPPVVYMSPAGSESESECATLASSRISETIAEYFAASRGVSTSVVPCGRRDNMSRLQAVLDADAVMTALSSPYSSSEAPIPLLRVEPRPCCSTTATPPKLAASAQFVLFCDNNSDSNAKKALLDWSDRWAEMRVVCSASCSQHGHPMQPMHPTHPSVAFLDHILRLYPYFPEVIVFVRGDLLGSSGSDRVAAIASVLDAVASRGLGVVSYMGLSDRWGRLGKGVGGEASATRRTWDLFFAGREAAKSTIEAGSDGGDLRTNLDGTFAVGRANILAHPREAYSSLRELLRCEGNDHHLWGQAVEALWTPIFSEHRTGHR